MHEISGRSIGQDNAMSNIQYTAEHQKNSVNRPGSAVVQNGASGSESYAEFYGYPFICGYSDWTPQEASYPAKP